MRTKHLAEVDVLRFFAASAVAVYHLGFWIWIEPEGIMAKAAGGAVSYPELAWFLCYGWVGVELFFTISGFVIASSATNSTWPRFLRSRVVRLAPAAWICATITVVVLLTLNLRDPQRAALSYLRSVLFVPYPQWSWVDPVYWTLGVEVAFYALVMALLATRGEQSIKPVMAAVGLTSGAFWAAYWFVMAYGSPGAQALWVDLSKERVLQLLLVQHGSFFALGVYLWCLRNRAASRIDRLAVLLWIGIGMSEIAAKATQFEPWIGYRIPPVTSIVVWMVSVVVLAASGRGMFSLRPRPWLRQLGLATYPLYLIHNVVGCALIGVLAGAGMHRYLALATAVAAMVSLSFGISVYVEPRLQRALTGVLP